ncbi:DUF4181 domain-containing protein [Marinococcus luteus]|uniref:DUF4181 domain-containing protein n=1 Tax=Marinococcus luteus TaxID=1122204 RepID=UPI002ACCAE0E|nr:DUF4181 domain-containing protein [Marinococcus luteus]MDZ5782000.1 DUF4181 domain-containing protein [Marinococcus luteus]
MPEFFSVAGIVGILLIFLLELWIVPKGAVTLKKTKGKYWSNGILGAVIVMVIVLPFTTEVYSQNYFPLFVISSLVLVGAAKAWLEWYFAREAKEYIVTSITILYFIVSYLALELLF